MLQLLAAAGRVAMAGSRASAVAGRAAGAARLAGKAVTNKGVRPGGGFANSGFRPQKVPFASRALESAWAIQAWNQQLESWFPSVKHAATVTVVGGKVTPNKDVVHAALSMAFGALAHRPSSIAKVTIAVKNNPTTNEVAVSFLIDSCAALFVAEILSQLIFRSIAAVGDIVLRGVKDNVKEMPSAVGGVAGGAAGSGGGIFIRGWEDKPPGNVGGGGAGIGLDKKIKQMNDALAGQFGGGGVFLMGREAIFGGKPPLLTNMQDKGGHLFDEAVYKKWLTREPDLNPLPPAHDGVDLRTLVAQVLHDPGVRPPTPRTDKGPPVVVNEVKGN